MTTPRHPSSNHETDLGRFRYHTGGQPTRLGPEDECPPLFRDIGFEAMARFLRGELHRLCGPLSPITYLRSADYREPYVDYGRIGRVMLLRPRDVNPWHSGIEAVYIAPRDTAIDSNSMVFIPAEIPLREAATRFTGINRRRDFADAVGPALYADMIQDSRGRLDELQRSHEEAERIAAPLRKLFQSMSEADREQAAQLMERAGLTEGDLCTAWHHLPDARRADITAALRTVSEALPC